MCIFIFILNMVGGYWMEVVFFIMVRMMVLMDVFCYVGEWLQIDQILFYQGEEVIIYWYGGSKIFVWKLCKRSVLGE